MDTYQPIYDAVRSCIRNGDVGAAVEMAFRNADLGNFAGQALYAVQRATEEYERPCVVFKARLYRDGDQWCAIVGDDLQVVRRRIRGRRELRDAQHTYVGP